VLWYLSGEHYLGTLVIRHELTPQLAELGGNVGYHVVAPWRHQGHATRMLAAGLIECRRLGLDRVLLTCDPENAASRRVIAATVDNPTATPPVKTAFGSPSPRITTQTATRSGVPAEEPSAAHPPCGLCPIDLVPQRIPVTDRLVDHVHDLADMGQSGVGDLVGPGVADA